MSEKEDYLTAYRKFFESFAATVNPEDQLPINIAGYTITEAELPGEVLYWTTQYLTEKQCPASLLNPLRRIILDEVQTASKKQPKDFGYRQDDSVYIALRLMQAAMARVNDVCLRYLDNSQLDTLPPPPTLPDIKTVSAANKNSRRMMEDRHVEIGNLEAVFGIETTEPTSFYAVYDGHAGSAAATYCAAHLHQYLVESQHYTTDIRQAMREAFLRTDAEFVNKSTQDHITGGSTAVCVAVRGRCLVAGWAGDSQALLAKRMRLMQLVHPHKPSRKDEKERIEASGGAVMYWGTWRVNGQLAVSRAIGDAQYKPYVTAMPEIATVDLDGDEDFVVIACDGLWDFVSEDQVALAVYWQIAANPDDLKAVTNRLIAQAKKQGSTDNISIIVVFFKEPRAIAADSRSPMDLGLDNALANGPPPFALEAEACKRQLDHGMPEPEDNGVDNSDSDSEDLGPETAVDVDDLDAEMRTQDPAPPTPPVAHTVEDEGHIDTALVDNVAESGEDSEDEWNYFKGEKENTGQTTSEDPEEQPRSDTPCQDNSAWETSSVDMNSSPLNPDAPVFVPGGVGDVLLAESPRKPLPMDDIELPDGDRFRTEAVVRPADLLDLDNCDQLNGHHNISIDDAAKLNGNEKCNMDSLGFGFSVGVDPDKNDTSHIEEFERIQKDTTDFCNIQVFQAQTETNPFASETNDEFLERLKNKERDPMSMSFYQEKDDDTCERLSTGEPVDLNAVQMLPDCEDDDLQTNGDYNHTDDKENHCPDQDLLAQIDNHQPDNDIIQQNLANFEQNEHFVDYENSANNVIQNVPNINFSSSETQDTVLQTDTPESHKLMFEQIPEIPDGKSSELGFTTEDIQSESEKDTRPFTPQDENSQDVDMETKEELLPEDSAASLHDVNTYPEDTAQQETPSTNDQQGNFDIITENKELNDFPEKEIDEKETEFEFKLEPPQEQQSDEALSGATFESQSSIPANSPLPTEAQLQSHSPLPCETEFQSQSPFPAETQLQSQSPFPSEVQMQSRSPLPSESPVPDQAFLPSHSPVPTESQFISESLLSSHNELESKSPVPEPMEYPSQSPFQQSPLPCQSPLPAESQPPCASPPPAESPAPANSALSVEPCSSPLPSAPLLPSRSPLPSESPQPSEPAPDVVPEPVECHAQEICLPVTAELRPEEEVLPAAGPSPTPPPTPAAQPETEAPFSDPAPPQDVPAEGPVAAVEVATAVAAVTAAVGAAAAVKSKTPAKKTATPTTKAPVSKTTPRPSATPKTPTSTADKRTTMTVASKTTASPTKTTSTARDATAPKTTAAARPAPTKLAAPRPAAAKPAAPRPTAAKPAAPRPAAAKPAAPRPAPISRPAAKSAAPVKDATAVTKSAAPSRMTAHRPAAARPASSARPATAPAAPRAAAAAAPRAAPRPAAARPAALARPAPAKAPEKKPLTNGDARPPPIKRPTAARPAAPRPAPRTTAPATTNGPARAPADKAGKELANRRVTAAPTKTLGTKTAVSRAPKTPPAPADSALPDVIA